MLAPKIAFLLVAAVLAFSGQNQQRPAPAVDTPPPATTPVATHALFIDPLTPAVYELPAGALATWRQFKDCKPALVLFSAHPLLVPLEKDERNSVREFVRSAPPEELVRRSKALVADTVLTSPRAVSAAIEAGLISELIFVQPTTKPVTAISLAEFQQKAFAAGFLTEQEALALSLKDGVISGSVRGLPFRCVHPEALPKLAGPAIVHLDLGFFKDLFVNDVKTPLYDLLYQTIQAIRAASWPTVATTLSYSNQEAEFSLETRFLISNLADLLERPEWLAGGSPITWKQRANARYARAMIDNSTADELTAQAVETSPADPDAIFALALLRLAQKNAAEGFALLDRAVAFDPGYALAYLELAEAGVTQGNWVRSEELFRKAAANLSDNPFVRIGLADLLIRRERGNEALPLLEELKRLPWSPAYHPGIPKLLEEMSSVAKEQAPKP